MKIGRKEENLTKLNENMSVNYVNLTVRVCLFCFVFCEPAKFPLTV